MGSHKPADNAGPEVALQLAKDSSRPHAMYAVTRHIRAWFFRHAYGTGRPSGAFRANGRQGKE
jgi:hypothetical protein